MNRGDDDGDLYDELLAYVFVTPNKLRFELRRVQQKGRSLRL